MWASCGKNYDYGITWKKLFIKKKKKKKKPVQCQLCFDIEKEPCIETIERDKWMTFVKYFALVLSVKYFTIGWPNFTLWL